MSFNLTEKADPDLIEALQSRSEDELLCVILKLDTGPESCMPRLCPSDFPSRIAYRQVLSRLNRQQTYEAVANTLEELRSFGLEPQGWELGQAIVHGNRAAILKALACEGVEFGVLNWDLGLYEALVNDEANLRRYLATDNNAKRDEAPATSIHTDPGSAVRLLETESSE